MPVGVVSVATVETEAELSVIGGRVIRTETGDANAARALWVAGPQRLELRRAAVKVPAADEAFVRTLFSGVSRGTERLVFEGRVPEAEYERMRCPLQEGSFPGPVKYGYAAVGVVERGPAALEGRTVFCLHPHQERFVAPADMLHPVPERVPAARAVLAANMETALNALWDSGAGPGDRIVVVGGGFVGGLVAALAGRLPGADVTLVDRAPKREALAKAFGVGFALPENAPRDADVVFHASAHPAGLASAVACAGFEASIVELSWYGEGVTPVPLGGAFHSKRLRIVGSQVGHVSPLRRPRWDYGRRLRKALDLLDDPRLDAFLTHEIPFADAPQRLPALLAADADALAVALRY